MAMWRAGMAGLIAVLAVGASQAAVAAAPAPKTLTCTITTTRDAQGMHVNMDARVWVKGQKARVESHQPGGGPILVLVNGNHEWLLDPAQKQGMVDTLGTGKDAPKNPTDVIMARVGTLTHGAKKLGQQKLDGYPCDVYETARHAPDGSMTIKSWITRTTQPRLPLKVEMKMQVRRPNMSVDQTQTIRISQLRFGMPVSDSLFQVPAGFKIVPAPARGGIGAPGLPGMGMNGAGGGPRP